MRTRMRTHREWFRPVSLGGRKSCPECKTRLDAGESIWSWGEYIRAKWRTVGFTCKHCWKEVAKRLEEHRDECGCKFELVPYHCSLPEWMKLPEPVPTN